MIIKRTFIAVSVADSVKEMMNRIRSEIPGLADYAKFVNPAISHLTLRFFGETSELQINEIQQMMKNAIHQEKFEFTVSKTGVFPNSRKPSVLWFGVHDQRNQLHRLQQSVEQIALNTGFQPEQRPFSPHITLGRIKDRSRYEYPGLKDFLSYPEFYLPNPVNQVIFYESRLKQTGPEYHEIFSVTL